MAFNDKVCHGFCSLSLVLNMCCARNNVCSIDYNKKKELDELIFCSALVLPTNAVLVCFQVIKRNSPPVECVLIQSYRFYAVKRSKFIM